MSEDSYDKKAGQIAKERITSRYRFSKWFGRIMLACCIGGGTMLADGSANNSDGETTLGIIAIAGPALVTLVEKNNARYSMESIEARFRNMNNGNDGKTRTVLQISNGDFLHKVTEDSRTKHDFNDVPFYVMGPSLALTGYGTALKAITNNYSELAGTSPLHMLGSVMFPAGLSSFVCSDIIERRNLLSALQRIDNIENGLLSLPPDSTES